MCNFTLAVIYCKCIDKYCRKKAKVFGEDQFTPNGHIIKVIQCFERQGESCGGRFTNTDPKRPLVKYGVNPAAENSTFDCIAPQYYIEEKRRTEELCETCAKRCQNETIQQRAQRRLLTGK